MVAFYQSNIYCTLTRILSISSNITLPIIKKQLQKAAQYTLAMAIEITQELLFSQKVKMKS